MTRQVTWPHEVVYTVAGKAAVYDDISMPLFMQGYLIVMEGKKEAVSAQMASHHKDLVTDSELYGWVKVQAYHVVWRNQLEQCQVSWDD